MWVGNASQLSKLAGPKGRGQIDLQGRGARNASRASLRASLPLRVLSIASATVNATWTLILIWI